MTDKQLIKILRDYTKAYIDGKPYYINPGLALMIANRVEQLVALVENGQSAIDTNQRLAGKLVEIENDFKKAITADDYCSICKNYIPCKGKECDCYVEGKGATDEKGNYIDWSWTCMDFNYGDCPKMDDVPCKDCKIISHFIWRGNEIK